MIWDGVTAAIAGLSLVVSVAAYVRGEQRERRSATAQDRSRLELRTSRLSDGALLVEVAYRPPSDHTRFRAVLAVAKPANALLSEPGWESNSTPGFVIMPSPSFDPKAVQRRGASLDLTEYFPFGGDRGVGAQIVAHAPGGLPAISLNINIQDIATGATVLTVQETLTA